MWRRRGGRSPFRLEAGAPIDFSSLIECQVVYSAVEESRRFRLDIELCKGDDERLLDDFRGVLFGQAELPGCPADQTNEQGAVQRLAGDGYRF